MQDAKIQTTPCTENQVARVIVDVAFHIHQAIGPGLLESVYEAILARGLEQRGLFVARQQPMRVQFEDMVFDEGFRADLVVNDLVIVEVKAIEHAVAIHKRQLLTYLRMTNRRLGILINFGESLFKDGCFRVANGVTDDERQPALLNE